MSAPTAATERAWPDGQLADVEYSARSSQRRTAVTRCVWHDGSWYDQRTGFQLPPEFIRAVNPLYLVSLDAAVEAAAKEFCRIHLGDVWDSITEPARDGYRDYFRSVLTAAVRGCVN